MAEPSPDGAEGEETASASAGPRSHRVVRLRSPRDPECCACDPAAWRGKLRAPNYRVVDPEVTEPGSPGRSPRDARAGEIGAAPGASLAPPEGRAGAGEGRPGSVPCCHALGGRQVASDTARVRQVGAHASGSTAWTASDSEEAPLARARIRRTTDPESAPCGRDSAILRMRLRPVRPMMATGYCHRRWVPRPSTMGAQRPCRRTSLRRVDRDGGAYKRQKELTDERPRKRRWQRRCSQRGR